MKLSTKQRVFATCLVAMTISASSAATLTWGGRTDILSLDPYSHGSTSNLAFLNHVYEGLVRYNDQLRIEPALATKWEFVDGNKWRFTLREGVKFHDGADFTAEDVVASFKRVSHPTSPLRGNMPLFVEAVAVNDHTVDLVVNSPSPLFINDLTNIFIFDAGWLVKNKSELPTSIGEMREGYATFHANGTGPFSVESRVPDSKTVLVKYNGWWDHPKHNLDRIEYLPIVSPATRVAALLSGEVKLIDSAPLQDIKRIEANPAMKVIQRPELRTVAIYFNRRDTLADGRTNFFNDLRFRQAIDYAIDRDTIAKRVMRGMGRVAGTPVAPEVPGYSKSLDTPTPYQPEQSKKLLEASGLTGSELTYLCMTDEYINEEDICRAIVSMLGRVGLKVSLDVGPRSIQTAKRSSGQADMYMLGWANEPTLDSYSILTQVLATRTGASGVANYGGWSYPELDALIQKISLETDASRRQALEEQALSLVKKEVLVIPLHQQPIAWAANKAVDTVVVLADNKPRHWLTVVK